MKHIERLLDMAKDGTFKYGGRDNAADPLILSGQAGDRLQLVGRARRPGEERRSSTGRRRSCRMIPEIIAAPLNSIIGGASLWPMTAPNRTPAEYKAVAQFLNFLGKPENAAAWHQNTGYVPVTLRRLRAVEAAGLLHEESSAPTCRWSSLPAAR